MPSTQAQSPWTQALNVVIGVSSFIVLFIILVSVPNVDVVEGCILANTAAFQLLAYGTWEGHSCRVMLGACGVAV